MAGYIGSKAVNLSTTGADIAGDADVSGALDVGGGLTVDNDGSTVLTVDRATSDGTIIDVQKSGSSVGSIGVVANDRLYIATDDSANAGLAFDGDNSRIYACTSVGDTSDNTTDLGYTDSRFKDLYLSGGVYLGGTGAANKLDDYEEGTYTPVFNYSNAVVYSNQTGRYCKVGNLVFVSIDITITSKSSDLSQVHVSLPFVATHGAESGVAGSVDYYSSSLVPSSRVAWQPSNYSNDSVRFNGQGGLHTYNSLNSSGRLVAGFTYYI